MAFLSAQRNWLLAVVLLAAVVMAAVFASHPTQRATVGSGPRPRIQFGSTVPLPAAAGSLVYTNGWAASVGAERVAVYAGRERGHRRNGLLVIEHVSTSGRRRLRSVVLDGSGSLTLVRPLPTAQTEQAAESASLRFVAADGAVGTLAVATGKVSMRG